MLPKFCKPVRDALGEVLPWSECIDGEGQFSKSDLLKLVASEGCKLYPSEETKHQYLGWIEFEKYSSTWKRDRGFDMGINEADQLARLAPD